MKWKKEKHIPLNKLKISFRLIKRKWKKNRHDVHS